MMYMMVSNSSHKQEVGQAPQHLACDGMADLLLALPMARHTSAS